MKIEKKTAVVSGGASGLGAATVRMLIEAGANVAILDFDADRGEAYAKEMGSRALFVKTNVADEASVIEAIAKTKQTFGDLHICVNCAGIPGKSGRIVSKKGPYALDEFRRVLDVNLIGTFNVARLAAAEMVTNTPDADGECGVIINTSSLAGIEGQMGQIAYAASKAGVIGMMLPMVRDLSQFSIRVCTIAPGLFETPMAAGTPPEVKQMLIATLESPKRLGRPDEYAHLVQSIIENAYLNGDVFRIDAGTRAPAR